MYQVLRTIHFSYGHRLLNHPGKCARLHGHNGKVIVEVSSETLDDQKMVMDFYDIRAVVEKWIDDTLDHRMILCKVDPAVKALESSKEELVVIQDNPTAEILAKMIFDAAKERGLPITKVTLCETDDSAAVYAG